MKCEICRKELDFLVECQDCKKKHTDTVLLKRIKDLLDKKDDEDFDKNLGKIFRDGE